MRLTQTLLPAWLLCLVSCVDNDLKVTVSNETGEDLGRRVIELPARSAYEKLKTPGFYVTDPEGKEIPSQLTSDGKILFAAEVPQGLSYVYKIHPCDTMPRYEATVWGDFYPLRRDDISYENEVVGFRIYGPGTQNAGEKAFGYDLFFKYPTEELIVPQLYAPETDPEVWARVDSLRKISDELAESYIKTFSYHLDHGKGMDCYAVGATLGAGVAAILENDTIRYPWCYKTAEILDNGPLRFTVSMEFNPFLLNGKEITEQRIITLDSYSHLNNTKIWYQGLDKATEIVAGFPLRDASEPYANPEEGVVAYADPTQGETNGKALLGIITTMRPDSSIRKEDHVLLVSTVNPADTFNYRWGFAWDKTDIKSMPEWIGYLEKAKLNYTIKY